MYIINSRRCSFRFLLFLGLAFSSVSFFFFFAFAPRNLIPCRPKDPSASEADEDRDSAAVNDENESSLPYKDNSNCRQNTQTAENHAIPCRINDKVLRNLGYSEVDNGGPSRPQEISCRLEKDRDIFVPFSFLKQYFEIRGEIKEDESGVSFFSWSHSYSKVFSYLKEKKYETSGPFLHFANYEVESRPRVLCISASQGVPVSMQWNKNGHFYSTQISQYALSHWSRYVNGGDERRTETLYESGKAGQTANWSGDTTRVESQNCIHFDKPLFLKINNSKEFILGVDLQNVENASLVVSLRSGFRSFIVRYVPSDLFISASANIVTYGYGAKKHLDKHVWTRLNRNLINDVVKGLQAQSKRRPALDSEDSVVITELRLYGIGCVTNLTLSSSAHLKFFFDGADWLLRNQDAEGGWPISVTFNEDRLKYPKAEEIPPGWYSGMAQGHALSVLTRAYLHSKDEKYLRSARRSLEIFESRVRARFMEKYVWFEEYPTTPSTFVLNGFMYSLIGLYDLKRALENSKAEILYNEGMESLKALLPLYDTGSGSIYDLRHFTMQVQPKLARWDYHSTHINLLYAISTLVEDLSTKTFFLETADRWVGYMLGKRAEHN